MVPSRQSQISSSSSSHASITSNPHHRSRTPSFTVHPSLRTGYHPSAAGHYPVPPHNQFMKTPAESLHHPRRQPKLFPSTTPQSIIRYDPVDDALVPRPASTLQQAITFHASSFTPDPIYRARYLVQPVDNSQQDSHKPYAPQTGYERGIQRPPHIQHRNHIERAYYGQSVPLAIPQQKLRQEPHSATSHVPKHVHLPKHVEFKDLSPTRSIFSRPASPVNISDRQSVAPGCFRSSTLHRQETDQSSYSQATLPDTYLRSNIQVSEDHTSTPLSLSDWKPLSVDSVRSSSPNARELWQDLERALLGTPAIGSSEACTPTAISPISETGKGMGEEVLAVAVETTYDFTHSSISHKSVDQHESGNSAYARPPLLRRDRSKDRLEHHRGLGSSIVEKARNSAAQTSRPATTTLASQESIPLADSDGPGVTHVDTPREELKSNHEQSAVTVSKTLKKPVVRNGTRRASKIPVPSQRLSKGTLHAPRKAGVKHTISATLPSQDSPTTESPWASR